MQFKEKFIKNSAMQSSAAFKLLRKEQAPFILAFLSVEFKGEGRIDKRITTNRLNTAIQVDAPQTKYAGSAPRGEAKDYIREWISEGYITEADDYLFKTHELDKVLDFYENVTQKNVTTTSTALKGCSTKLQSWQHN